MVYGILSALQSAVMVMAVTRVEEDLEKAGIISLAYAAAYLMQTAAAYGVRNFHASDVTGMYSFWEYKAVRNVTCALSFISAVGYCLCIGYDRQKMLFVACICILKLSEVYEDLLHGELQRLGRLDAACRFGTFRMLAGYGIILVLLSAGSGVFELFVTLAVQSIIFVCIEYILLKRTQQEEEIDLCRCRKIIKECFPILFMNFLNIFICNVPKYAIDACLTEEVQAYFSILFMPVFCIGLLSEAIYRPKLVEAAQIWKDGRSSEFYDFVKKQVEYIFFITTAACLLGAGIGIRILGMLYGLPLQQYAVDFAVLLAGGGIAALVNFFAACLTVIRKHFLMAGVFSVTAAAAFGISKYMVEKGGLRGAAALYVVLMSCELLFMAVIIVRYWRRET